ncbi:MAG TPA: methyltransferase domain-containing protein [Nitrospiria bacterium]|jgi:ubiquinone/menaquinone biosynthesis C-methylase UbiE
MKAPYLHGYSLAERKRLIDQANYLKETLYRQIRFPKKGKVLEVGCAVGAQLGILDQRFPGIHLLGVDLSLQQLSEAKTYLKTQGINRPNLVQGDARKLPFSKSSLDAIFTCWFFEHVSHPIIILKECRRVLKPKKRIYMTEVENNSVCIWPESKPFKRFWNAFNKTQLSFKGDPFVGKKLYPLLKESGFSKIKVYPITFHYNQGSPQGFTRFVAFFFRIGQSAVKQIVQNGGITENDARRGLREFCQIAKHPNGVISFTCYRGIGTR